MKVVLFPHDMMEQFAGGDIAVLHDEHVFVVTAMYSVRKS
jgi:hypothetical protein